MRAEQLNASSTQQLFTLLEVRKKCYRLSDGKRSRLREKNEEHTERTDIRKKDKNSALHFLFCLFVASILCP